MVSNDIFLVNADSDKVTFFSDDMVLVNVDCNNVSLDDVNFDNDDPETMIHIRLMTWCDRYKQQRHVN